MDKLRRHKARQRFWILFSAGFLAALLVLSICFREPEEQRVARDFTAALLARDPRSLTPAEREELRGQWERFSPETRAAILRGVARSRLEQFRAEAARLTPEERRARVRQATAELQRHPARDLSPAQREQVRVRMSSPQGQQLVREVLTFYQTELTAEERAELDPLVRAWMQQVEELTR